MIAGFIAGVLAAIPICAIRVSSSNSSPEKEQELVVRTAIFVVGVLTLLGLLVGAYQEVIKQTQSNRYGYLPDKIQQSYLISEVLPTEYRD
ncbi:hypothetical protein [Aerosakkonema funiforme]|uniref:Uncharacterized protein n=1 Tax=Aerosakkonema funiforme FACHB-1375 TaxID=2949571 RepID=A0A926ZH90_9CYAN|nr:hypothetical protein [Aerosakkonema funiforme]MBD2181927.1 hypothetical protein [Aerosakkonema funiforme FACHB-1375]